LPLGSSTTYFFDIFRIYRPIIACHFNHSSYINAPFDSSSRNEHAIFPILLPPKNPSGFGSHVSPFYISNSYIQTMKKKFLVVAAVLILMIAAGLIFMNSQNTGKAKNRYALVQTDKGDIKFEIFEKEAPITAANFIKLAQSGFYNELKFHRYEPGFVIQGGDPNGDGTGGSNETIPLEIVFGLNFSKGAVGMARANDPNSASSQFFITLEDSHFLDGGYAVFGKVVEGMDVVLSLRAGDVMRKVEIVQ